MGRELYRSEDEWGPIIVTQRGNKRILNFASRLEQSSVILERPEYLTHEYTQVMLLSLLFVEAEHITLLGLGGGSLVHCLAHFYPRLPLQIVELRQRVIDVAVEWFELPQSEQIQIECINAADYIENADDQASSLILSDLYEAEGMSEEQAKLSYINNCFRHLADNGVLVLNFHQLPDVDDPLIQQLALLFAELWVCDVFSGNHVLFCLKQNGEKDLAAGAKQLAKKLQMPLVYYARQLRKLVV